MLCWLLLPLMETLRSIRSGSKAGRGGVGVGVDWHRGWGWSTFSCWEV